MKKIIKIVIVIVIIFSLISINFQFNDLIKKNDQILINNKKINKNELNTLINNISLKKKKFLKTKEFKEKIEKIIIENISFYNKLINMGIFTNKKELLNYITLNEIFQKNKKFKKYKYINYINEKKINESDFQNILKKNLIQNKLFNNFLYKSKNKDTFKYIIYKINPDIKKKYYLNLKNKIKIKYLEYFHINIKDIINKIKYNKKKIEKFKNKKKHIYKTDNFIKINFRFSNKNKEIVEKKIWLTDNDIKKVSNSNNTFEIIKSKFLKLKNNDTLDLDIKNKYKKQKSINFIKNINNKIKKKKFVFKNKTIDYPLFVYLLKNKKIYNKNFKLNKNTDYIFVYKKYKSIKKYKNKYINDYINQIKIEKKILNTYLKIIKKFKKQKWNKINHKSNKFFTSNIPTIKKYKNKIYIIKSFSKQYDIFNKKLYNKINSYLNS